MYVFLRIWAVKVENQFSLFNPKMINKIQK